jgi:Zn-dependent alcohol dehydrogenase
LVDGALITSPFSSALPLKLDELIARRYAPEQINEAMEAVERGEAPVNVITW